jgi:uncharacterized membrane protein YccC
MNSTMPDPPVRRNALRSLIASMLHVEWARFEIMVGVRCTIGIAIPLFGGLAAGRPAAAMFGALGAFGVGFGSFQGAYRSRAIPMLLATLSMAGSVLVGSLAGHSIVSAVVVAGLWGFAGGLLVALGRSASFVGLQAIVALLIAGGIPTDLGTAATRALFVLGGGVGQTLLVVMIWPLRRFSSERRSLAAVYRSVAAYAAAIPERAAPPEPHTLADTLSPLADPQPFATTAEMLGFQALLNEAERIRVGLAALAFHHQRLLQLDPSCAVEVCSLTAQVLREISAALAMGREPRAMPGVAESLADCAERLSPAIPVKPLLTQLDAAWRTAGLLASDPRSLAHADEGIQRRRNGRFMRDALTTLRANLSFDSTAFRHALRLGATIALAQVIAAALALPRGYWAPLAVAVMMKPEFHDTLAASLARIGGTALGAGVAIAIALRVTPGSVPSIAFMLAFAWAVYAMVGVNPVVSAVCITGYIVFLLSLSGVPQGGVAAARIINTGIGGGLALGAYVLWPAWTAQGIREVLAKMLDGQALYLHALLTAYTDPGSADIEHVDGLRTSARRARSNAEAIIERTFASPYGRPPMQWRTAMGTLAANRRMALAALALRAGLLSEDGHAVPTMAPFAHEVRRHLRALAAAARGHSLPADHPRDGELAATVSPDIDPMLSAELGMIVDALDTMALLLRSDHDPDAVRGGAASVLSIEGA